MPWQFIGSYLLNKDWVLTPPVLGEVFRITHRPLQNPEKKYIKAVFAQCFIDRGLNIFEPKRLSYRQESELFIHFFPAGLTSRQLAFKRLDENLNIIWSIEAEVYSSGNPENDLANLMLSNINNIMSIYSRGSAGLTPKSGEGSIQADTPTRLLQANDKRQMVIIRTTDFAVQLYAGVDDAGAPVGMLESLAANETYEFPVEQGVYRGEIFVVSSANTEVNYTEYSA